jgi:nitrilase
MTYDSDVQVTVAQVAPVVFDLNASVEKAVQTIEEAARAGSHLVAFGETWLSGYPLFAWNNRRDPHWDEAAAAYTATAVEIPGPITDQLCEAARRAGIDVAIGVLERNRETKGTVYCTLLFISQEGHILGRHRKLKPTGSERLIWGEGDGWGLKVYARPYGRISGLNCWEHKMMLPGYTLMAAGTQIHVGTWPGFPEEVSRHIRLSRTFAMQGACYVMATGQVIDPANIPEEFRHLYYMPLDGHSAVIDPHGEVVADGGKGEKLLTANISMKEIAISKTVFDIAGHYSRPDVFQLTVSQHTPQPVVVSSATSNPGQDELNSPHLSDSRDHALSPAAQPSIRTS